MGNKEIDAPRKAKGFDLERAFARKRAKPEQAQRRVLSPAEKRIRQFSDDLRAVLEQDRRS